MLLRIEILEEIYKYEIWYAISHIQTHARTREKKSDLLQLQQIKLNRNTQEILAISFTPGYLSTREPMLLWV